MPNFLLTPWLLAPFAVLVLLPVVFAFLFRRTEKKIFSVLGLVCTVLSVFLAFAGRFFAKLPAEEVLLLVLLSAVSAAVAYIAGGRKNGI